MSKNGASGGVQTPGRGKPLLFPEKPLLGSPRPLLDDAEWTEWVGKRGWRVPSPCYAFIRDLYAQYLQIELPKEFIYTSPGDRRMMVEVERAKWVRCEPEPFALALYETIGRGAHLALCINQWDALSLFDPDQGVVRHRILRFERYFQGTFRLRE